MKKQGVFKNIRHQLFLLEETFPEGVWRCHVELGGDRIYAYPIHFTSVESPVMGKGIQLGNGRFLNAEYPPWILHASDRRRGFT